MEQMNAKKRRKQIWAQTPKYDKNKRIIFSLDQIYTVILTTFAALTRNSLV